jgi:hypothetical protein
MIKVLVAGTTTACLVACIISIIEGDPTEAIAWGLICIHGLKDLIVFHINENR